MSLPTSNPNDSPSDNERNTKRPRFSSIADEPSLNLSSGIKKQSRRSHSRRDQPPVARLRPILPTPSQTFQGASVSPASRDSMLTEAGGSNPRTQLNMPGTNEAPSNPTLRGARGASPSRGAPRASQTARLRSLRPAPQSPTNLQPSASSSRSTPRDPQARLESTSEEAGSGEEGYEVDTNFRHGPTNLPPETYRTAKSPWKPKKRRPYSSTLSPDTLENLTRRMDRLEASASQYVARRREEALANSVVPGLEDEEDEKEDD